MFIRTPPEGIRSRSRQHHRSREVAWMVRIDALGGRDGDGETMDQDQLGERVERGHPDRRSGCPGILSNGFVWRVQDPHQRSLAGQAAWAVSIFHGPVRL